MYDSLNKMTKMVKETLNLFWEGFDVIEDLTAMILARKCQRSKRRTLHARSMAQSQCY